MAGSKGLKVSETKTEKSFKIKRVALVELCRVGEHQHQLAHQCSPNIYGIWEWGICGLMGRALTT